MFIYTDISGHTPVRSKHGW